MECPSYSVRHGARAITALACQPDEVASFLIGTYSFDTDRANELHLLKLSESELTREQVWKLALPFKVLAAHPRPVSRVFAGIDSQGVAKLFDASENELLTICELSPHARCCRWLAFDGDDAFLLVSCDTDIRVFRVLHDETSVAKAELCATVPARAQVTALAVHYNAGKQQLRVVAALDNKTIQITDLSVKSDPISQQVELTVETTRTISTGRVVCVEVSLRGLLLTGDVHGRVRIWRENTKNSAFDCVNELTHDGMVLCIRCHTQHGAQVVAVSTSADEAVHMWTLPRLDLEHQESKNVDNVLRKHGVSLDDEPHDDSGHVLTQKRVLTLQKEHADAVRYIDWACGDSASPWSLASLSIDGRLVISTVPPDVKYDVLLQ
ncbi:MAG: hypothetical protein MHM6MM_002197 [Cercozoa sp. M6MM]